MDADGLLETIKTRRSIRRFTDSRPERGEIERIVEAATWAPSNHNRQGWKFIVFERPERIRVLAERVRESVKKLVVDAPRQVASHSDELIDAACAFGDAPVVVLAMHKRRPAVGGTLVESAVGAWASGELLSTAMAIENLLLAAHAMGLGACPMTAPLLAGEVWRSLPDLPAGFEPTCLVALGYPAEHPPAPRRKALTHVIEYR